MTTAEIAEVRTPPRRLDHITGRWWFLLLIILLQFAPPITAKPFNSGEYYRVIEELLGTAIIYSHPEIYPILKIIATAMIAALLAFGRHLGRLFDLYTAACYVFFAFGQGLAWTPHYGFAILTSNVILFLLVAAAWAWDAIVPTNDFSFSRRPWHRYWPAPLAIFAFWYPLSIRTGRPDLGLTTFITSPAAAAFCLMTPVFITLLVLNWPNVNRTTLRLTGLAGAIIGLWNIPANFIVHYSLWNGLLHLPLLIISVYGLILSYRTSRTA